MSHTAVSYLSYTFSLEYLYLHWRSEKFWLGMFQNGTESCDVIFKFDINSLKKHNLGKSRNFTSKNSKVKGRPPVINYFWKLILKCILDIS